MAQGEMRPDTVLLVYYSNIPAIVLSMVVDGIMVGSVNCIMDGSVDVIMNSQCARGSSTDEMSQDGIRHQGLGRQTAN